MNLPTRMVVLDDDPTGIQTVHGCLLLTDWSEASLRKAFSHRQPFFYVLTNTRAMTREEAEKTTREVMEAVLKVADCHATRLFFVSRSDSCLRGHFPLETDVMRQVLTKHGVLVWPRIPFIPAFIEAGRLTIGGVHYMQTEQGLVPVSETEFAHDNVFGYHTSNLRDYIKEKGGSPDDYEIVDAAGYDELNAYCSRLKEETNQFRGSVVIRSSSSFPKAMSGIPTKSFLDRSILNGSKEVGCFIVGSHVKKTTRQLQLLLAQPEVMGIEVDVHRVFHDASGMMAETIKQITEAHDKKLTPVVFTSREEIRLDNAEERQHMGQNISDFLVDIVANLPFVPSYLAAKGGITSHDILTKGLHVKWATVEGQVINSVPCVMTEKFPYIIFPGNVGDDTSLVELYNKFHQ